MTALPVEVYEILEEEIGKERAKRVLKILEESLMAIEEKAKEQTDIAKIQIRQDLANELVTKGEFYSEIKRLEDKIDAETKRLEDKIEGVKAELKSDIKRLDDKLDIMQKLILLGFGGFLIPMLLILVKLYFV